jgi:hypothetical protein
VELLSDNVAKLMMPPPKLLSLPSRVLLLIVTMPLL